VVIPQNGLTEAIVLLRFGRGRAVGNSNTVWILGSDDRPVPIQLRLGITDGTFTEVVRGELNAGQAVLVGLEAEGRGSSDARGGRGRGCARSNAKTTEAAAPHLRCQQGGYSSGVVDNP
jgi:hypothetical protein